MLRMWFVLVAVLLSWAVAADVAVHPFRAQDPVVGVALAERMAGALTDVDVLGPEVVPALIAPIVVPDGFVNPIVFLPDGVVDATGVVVLADVLGVPAAVSGVLVVEADGLRLDLWAAVEGRLRHAVVRGPVDAPHVLAQRAATRVAGWIGGGTRPVPALDLAGPDGEAARARALIGAGFVGEARALLEGLSAPSAADARLRDDLVAALEGTDDGAPDLAAIVALQAGDPATTIAAFERWRAAGGPPVLDVWLGALAHSVQDDEAAHEAFDRAARYPYGQAAYAAYLSAVGDADAAAAELRAVADAPSPGALLAASLAAQTLGDPVLEDHLLAALGREAPFFAYPFERRSFLAFDRDDARTAAEVLAVAIDLEPESDLYWTNLGWARYLLGDLGGSEAASLRALELDLSQVIARYNLGLVQVVTGRLDAALATYADAVMADPEVDDEAIADLVNAETLYPAAVGVPYALGFLLEREGNRDAAADAYARYVDLASADPTDADATRLDEARDRIDALRAPPPPIEVLGTPQVSLSARSPALTTVQPGDPLTVSFEVSTPGEALPRRLELSATWSAVGGDGVLVEDAATVDVPMGAIGLVVDALRLELPADLPAGTYQLDVGAAGDGVATTASATFEVAGDPDPFRGLVGRGLVLTALETGQALVTESDLSLGRAGLVDRLVRELQRAAPTADEVLPRIESGRFEGSTGGEAFTESGPEEVLAFLRYLLDSGARATSFAFVDAYAQWVVEGAP